MATTPRPRPMLVKGGFDPQTGRFRAGSTIAVGTSVDLAKLWYPTIDGKALGAIVERIDKGFFAGGLSHSVALPGVAETLTELAGQGRVMGVATTTVPPRPCRRWGHRPRQLLHLVVATMR